MTRSLIRSVCRHSLASLLVLAAGAVAQEPKPLERPDDPYTQGEQRFYDMAGYEAVHSFLLSQSLRTEQVEEVLGTGQILWIETPHFRLGCGLASQPMPREPRAKAQARADLKSLRSRLPTIPASPRKMDRWLRAHLYAHRLEQVYQRFGEVAGFDQAAIDGHLGTGDKFNVLLFAKNSDLVRFYQRFTSLTFDIPMRARMAGSANPTITASEEAFDSLLRSDERMHCYLVDAVVSTLADETCNAVPLWMREGLAHWFVWQIEPKATFTGTSEKGMTADSWNWPKRVRARCKNDFFPTGAEMSGWTAGSPREYVDHMFMWSRTKYLMDRDAEATTAIWRACREERGGAARAAFLETQLLDRFEMDLAQFDLQWKAWALRQK